MAVNPASLKNLAPPIRKGQALNPGGNPVHLRRKLTNAFLGDMAADFKVHGKAAIVAAREKDPMGYVKAIASLLPKEIELSRPLEGLNDEELAAIAERLKSAISLAGARSGNTFEGELAEAGELPALPEAT